jgi:integrase/recombinase XerD
MNHRPSGSSEPAEPQKGARKRRGSELLVAQAIPGFLQFKTAEGLSKWTLIRYEHDLGLLQAFLENKEIGKISTGDLRDYMNYLRNDYIPRRIAGDGMSEKKLSPKSLRNHYITLRSFFTWAIGEFQIADPVKGVPPPKFTEAPFEPFTKEEIEALIKACDQLSEAKPRNRCQFHMRRPTAQRDKALILFLLDTGLRAGELCALKLMDVDLRTGKVQVKHGEEGGSKSKKGRTVFLGKAARRSLWRFLAEREDGEQPEAPLFTNKGNRPMNDNSLRLIMNRWGKKAGVPRCHPHRYRHTFAITYLRSGGDVFTLKQLLGHSTLEMVEHYARVAEVDIEQAHRKASPVDNWRL